MMDFREHMITMTGPIKISMARSVMIVPMTPGTRFSHKHQRKGRGKGYYDRFFADKDDIYKIGVTTEAQVIPEMRSNPWDVDMDVVVTEDRIL